MFLCSAVFSALGFNDIMLQCRCLLDYGPRDVLIRTSWPGGSSDRAQTPCDLLNWSHWACLLEIKMFLNFSRSIG